MVAPRALVLGALLALPGLAVGASPRAGKLVLTAAPDALRLAEGSRATLRIVGSGEPPTVSASVGRVEMLRETSSGVYEAEYVPPESLDPQIAFVTAVSADAFAWVPIALSGVRDVVVSARHGTPVTIAVGDEAFGPVPADGLGRATVRVVVPPGVHAARYDRRRIDLAVPEKSLVHVFLSSASADATAEAELTVRALVVTERGRPSPGAPLSLLASEGVLSPAAELSPGVFQARWKLAPAQVGQARVTARVRDRPASVASATLERVPGPVRRLAIEVDREALVAGEGDVLAVTARALDAAGNTTEAPLSIVVEPGTMLEWDRTARGRYEGRVQLPARRAGWPQLDIRVSASRALSATRSVPLRSGPARQIRFEPADDLQADGRPHEIRILVLDREGNRVDVADVPTVTARRGTVVLASWYAPGAFRVEYRGPLAAEDFEEVLRARVGPLEAESRLRVRALGAGLVLAPKVGFVMGTGGLASPSFGAEVGFWTRALGQSLGLVLEGWYAALDRDDAVQGLDLRTQVRFLVVEASLAWRRPVGGWMLWLGAGGGAAHGSSRISGAGSPSPLSGSFWVPAASAAAGVGRPAGPGVAFGELRFGWQGDPGSGPVRGAMQSVTLDVGYRFDVL